MLVAERARNAALLGEMRRLVGVLLGQGVKVEPGQAAAGGGGGGGGGDQQQQQQQQQKPPFGFLHEKGDLTIGDAETPLTTTTAFLLSQLQSLRELSMALRGVMARLAADDGALQEEEEEEEEEGEDREGADGKGQKKKKKKSWRRERLEYVETATKRHLENVRGLELGKNGEVRDGEWDGGGRSLARGEVESLERLADMLGGGRGEDEDQIQDQDRMDES
ncbi:hypothetical protein L209DRAFT_752068 [Thermothelomyces heterothallicus CBS 203.75]